MVVGVILGFSGAAYCGEMYIYCSQESGNRIYLTTPHTDDNLVPEGCLVQVISSDSNTIMPPDSNGNPQLPNILIIYPIPMARYIGTTPESTYSSGEYVTNPDWVASPGQDKWVFLRVWNAHTILGANQYGDSIPMIVPKATSFNYVPASFNVNTPKPGPVGPTGFIGTGESGTSIRWSWVYPGGANSYNLYNAVGDVLIASTTEATILESGLTGGYNTSEARYVIAILPGGPTSKSNTDTAYTLANTPVISAAKGGYSAGSKNYINVTWEANGNPAGTNYRLVRAGYPETTIPLTTLKALTDGNLSANQTYIYSVEALNGDSIRTTFSGTVSATTPPGKPTLTTTGVATNEIAWYWGPGVAGADSYNVRVSDGTSKSVGITAEISALSDPCRLFTATVEAVSAANGAGEPATLTKWTLPVTPSAPTGGTGTDPKSVDLYWSDNNFQALYEIKYSLTSDGPFVASPESNVAANQFLNLGTLSGSTTYYFRIRARNGDGVTSAYSDASGFTSQADEAGGGGNAPIISNVMFNGRPYTYGAIISSRPRITATVTCDSSVDVTRTSNAVYVDHNLTPGEIVFSASEVTYETVPGAPATPETWQLVVNSAHAISGSPVSSHTLTIYAWNTGNKVGSWNGVVGVMSGKAEMIGNAYNFPNPFRPLSGDPNQNKTKISYNLSVDASITLIIYDITGHEVHRATYSSGGAGGQAGVNTVEWNGQSLFGETLGNGMYLYKIISGNGVLGSGKLVILD